MYTEDCCDSCTEMGLIHVLELFGFLMLSNFTPPKIIAPTI